jgi:hypothetical protein
MREMEAPLRTEYLTRLRRATSAIFLLSYRRLNEKNWTLTVPALLRLAVANFGRGPD